MTTEQEKQESTESNPSSEESIFPEYGGEKSEPEGSAYDFQDPETEVEDEPQDDGEDRSDWDEIEDEETDSDDEDGDDHSADESDDDDSEDEEEESEDESDEHSAPKFDQKLLDIAQDFGFTREQALGFGSPEALEGALRNMSEAYQNNQPKAESSGDSKPDDIPPLDSFELNLPEGEYEQEVIDVFKGMNDHFQKVVNSLKSEVTALQQIENLREQKAREGRFDDMIAAAGKDQESIFGKGRADEIDRNGEGFQNRVRTWKEMEALQRADSFLGRAPRSEKELFKVATQSLFGDKLSKQASKSASQRSKKQIRDHMGRFSQRPTKRVTDENLSPDEKALAAVKAKFKEYGIND